MTKKYVLNNIALRSWWLAPHTYVGGFDAGQRFVNPVSAAEFELLNSCDGTTGIPESETLKALLSKGLIREAKDGEKTDPFYMHKDYENRYVPNMTLNITERCNFNCLHCYEAVDNNISRNEMSLDKCRKLIKEAGECGIQNIRITGGEPLMHPDFIDIVKCVYENEMTVDWINTNGFFITEELLDKLEAIDKNLQIHVSYDGAGFHDWMRCREGAEANLLEKIGMMVKRGFYVRTIMTLNRKNQQALIPTMYKMEEIGVKELRVIRTSETPRWLLNAGDACLTLEEYYDLMVGLSREYAASDLKIELNMWFFAKVFNDHERYMLVPVRAREGSYKPDMPICQNARLRITVAPDGEVFTCTPSPGILKNCGLSFGNVFDKGLKPILQDGKYLAFVCRGAHAVCEHDEKCGKCEYFRQCAGGCRLSALVFNKDPLAHDPSKCIFFENKYDLKLKEALKGYKCLNDVKR